MKIIRIIGCVDGNPCEFDGQFVSAYDPTVHLPDGDYDGGILEVTPDRTHALQFAGAGEAMNKWRQPAGCKCHGIRPWDGKENRPLTAWHVVIEDL